MVLQDIRPFHLNQFYNNLSEKGIRQMADRAIGKPEFRDMLKEKKLSMAKIAKLTGIAESTVNQAGKGQPILRQKAEAIAAAAQIDFDKLFTVQEHNEPLSNTSINAYHRFNHIVLAQAEKEMLVPYNAATKATPPPKEKSAEDDGGIQRGKAVQGIGFPQNGHHPLHLRLLAGQQLHKTGQRPGLDHTHKKSVPFRV